MQPVELTGLSREQLERLMAEAGEPAYRGRQIYHGIYRARQFDLGQMTVLPLSLRRSLQQRFRITLPHVERVYSSADGTTRYLFRLEDGKEIESVWMPEEARGTICISSQAGCPLDCKFCLTGVLGFVRNLSVGEIVGEVLRVAEPQTLAHSQRLNLVFMGMGEPMLNYENVFAAVRLLADKQGANISTSRMTLSTAGIVPGIERMGAEPVRPKLAVSLNAPNDELRDRLMPINRKWPIAQLLEACRRFPLREREKLTFEYVLLEGVNDSDAAARDLARVIRGIRCKVNLIGLNPGPELPFCTPPQEKIIRFQTLLRERGIAAFIRKPRGRDIFAACGQLKLANLAESAPVSPWPQAV